MLIVNFFVKTKDWGGEEEAGGGVLNREGGLIEDLRYLCCIKYGTCQSLTMVPNYNPLAIRTQLAPW